MQNWVLYGIMMTLLIKKKASRRFLAEKYEVDMPIIMEVNKVLFEDKPAADAVRDLMIRDKKVETPMLPW